MAEKKADILLEGQSKKNKSVLLIALAALLVLGGTALFLVKKAGNNSEQAVDNFVEYAISERMYQLKDGSYINLGFSILIAKTKLKIVEGLLTTTSASLLPDGINMILGNKSRDDLIDGTHKREAFSQEIKKVLEERVFHEYNKQQKSPQDMIEVRKVLLSTFVTQTG